MALAEGEISQQVFQSDHCQIDVLRPGKEGDLFALLSMILAVFRDS